MYFEITLENICVCMLHRLNAKCMVDTRWKFFFNKTSSSLWQLNNNYYMIHLLFLFSPNFKMKEDYWKIFIIVSLSLSNILATFYFKQKKL